MMLNRLKYSIFPENWQHANAYLIEADKRYLIDPGIDFDISIARNLNGIFATHFHFDHINQVDEWRANSSAEFSMPKADKALLTDPIANCSSMFGQPRTFFEPDFYYEDEQIFEVEKDLFFKFYLLPGHCPGCSAILVSCRENSEIKPFVLFSGDILFADSIGRTDLKGGNMSQMQNSLKRLIKILQTLPQNLPVLPGHGPVFTVSDALERNPFIQYFL